VFKKLPTVFAVLLLLELLLRAFSTVAVAAKAKTFFYQQRSASGIDNFGSFTNARAVAASNFYSRSKSKNCS